MKVQRTARAAAAKSTAAYGRTLEIVPTPSEAPAVTGSIFGIVCAMFFVAAPLYVGGAREAFARVDRRYEAVARTLGDNAWRAFRRPFTS